MRAPLLAGGRPPPAHRSRRARLGRIAAWLAAIALALAALDALGVDVRGWLYDLFDALTGVGLGYLIAGWSFQTAQTTLTALGWYFVLRAGFPDAPLSYSAVLASYATGVALNGFCRRTSGRS